MCIRDRARSGAASGSRARPRTRRSRRGARGWAPRRGRRGGGPRGTRPRPRRSRTRSRSPRARSRATGAPRGARSRGSARGPRRASPGASGRGGRALGAVAPTRREVARGARGEFVRHTPAASSEGDPKRPQRASERASRPGTVVSTRGGRSDGMRGSNPRTARVGTTNPRGGFPEPRERGKTERFLKFRFKRPLKNRALLGGDVAHTRARARRWDAVPPRVRRRP